MSPGRPLAAAFAADAETGAFFAPEAEIRAMLRVEMALAEAGRRPG